MEKSGIILLAEYVLYSTIAILTALRAPVILRHINSVPQGQMESTGLLFCEWKPESLFPSLFSSIHGDLHVF